MFDYDVLIVGGGVCGCALARELSRWQLKTGLLERCNDLCEGTSKANSAIVHPGHSVATGSLMAKYNLLGNRMYEELCRELSVPFQRNGCLNVAFSEDELPRLQALYEQGLRNGVAGMEILPREEVLRREPHLNPGVLKALYNPSSAITCPYELTLALAENALANGVAFHLEFPVEKILRLPGGWQVVSRSGEAFSAKILVNAAGLYSDVINNQVSRRTFRIVPRRGEYWMFDKNYAGTFHSTIFQLPGPMGKGTLISPTVDGTLILGPTAEDQEDREDTGTTAAGLDRLKKLGGLLWPELPRSGAITSFAGLRAHVDRTEHDFILGEPEDAPGFFNMAGIESPGLTSAPAMARALAEQIAGRCGAALNTVFCPERRKPRPFRLMSTEEKAAAVVSDPEYGRIICRCEQVTEAEIRAAARGPLGARTIDGIKRRTRAGMGRCQGGFCMPRVLEILAEEHHLRAEEVAKFGRRAVVLADDPAYAGPLPEEHSFVSASPVPDHPEIIVVGAGPAGLAAAMGAWDSGCRSILILERDSHPGGILQQCIHPGFGLHILGKELSGPEYARHYLDEVLKRGIPILCNTMVLDIDGGRRITCISPERGIQVFAPRAVVLAMGCRERPRGSIGLPGTRCSGIYSAGTAQRLLNLEGKLPGRRAVILGSGDIGLIMARRLRCSGAEVLAVAEIQPHSSGLRRNIVQCLEDFDIPLLLNHTVTRIHGKDRLTGVTISQVDSSLRPVPGTEKFYDCDTLLLSVGLIPENELSRKAGLEISSATGGPVVNQSLESSVPGIFVCGNVLHVHDLVDHVTEESLLAGNAAAAFAASGGQTGNQLPVRDGDGIRGTVPQLVTADALARGVKFSFRPLRVFRNAYIQAEDSGGRILKRQKRQILTPGEMADFTLKLKPEDLPSEDGAVILSVQEGEAK